MLQIAMVASKQQQKMFHSSLRHLTLNLYYFWILITALHLFDTLDLCQCAY